MKAGRQRNKNWVVQLGTTYRRAPFFPYSAQSNIVWSTMCEALGKRPRFSFPNPVDADLYYTTSRSACSVSHCPTTTVTRGQPRMTNYLGASGIGNTCPRASTGIVLIGTRRRIKDSFLKDMTGIKDIMDICACFCGCMCCRRRKASSASPRGAARERRQAKRASCSAG